MTKPIITYYCDRCKKTTFFAIEEIKDNCNTYKCRNCQIRLIDLNKETGIKIQ